MGARRALGAIAAILISACSQSASPPPAAAAAPAAPATAPAAQPSAAAATPAGETTPADPPASKIARTNEDGSETIEDTSGDSGSHNTMLAAVKSSTQAASAPAKTSSFVEGTNYTRLSPAQPTSVDADKVEVIEVFWYGCPHCYALEPYIEAWDKRKASYVTFVRVPVMWNDVHRSHARLFYTLESLGKLPQANSAVWQEIHAKGNMLVGNDAQETESKQLEFAGRFGVSAADFNKTYRSFAVETKLQRAEELTQRYRIDGVPKIIINGKFMADVASAGGPEKLTQLIDELAAQEHRH
jgi:protein dithiol oxidoreductase (disulfide-forming)